MQRDMVQIRITAPGKHLIAEGYVRKGRTLWVSKANAEQYINVLHIAEPAGAGVGPAEAPVAGPGEGGLAGPTEKKSSGADPAGPSTDSPKSSAPGTAPPSSASEAGPVSTPGKSPRSRRGGKAVTDKDAPGT